MPHKPEQKQLSVAHTPFFAAMIVGTAAFAALIILEVVSTAFVELSATKAEIVNVRLAFFAPLMIVEYALSLRRVARALESCRWVTAMLVFLGIALLLAPLALLAVPKELLPTPLLCTLFAVQGASAGLLLALFGTVWMASVENETHINTTTRIVFFAAVTTFFLFSVVFAPAIVVLIASLLLAVVSVAALLFCLRRKPERKNVQDVSVVVHHNLPLKAITHVAAPSLYLGYCTARVLTTESWGLALLCALPMILVAAIAVLVITHYFKRNLNATLAARLAFPTLIAGALFVWLPNPALAATLQFCFAVCGCSFFMVFHWGFICHWAVRYQLPSLAQAGFGLIGPTSGMMAGVLLQVVLIAWGAEGGAAPFIASMVFLLLFVLVSAIMPYGSEIRITDAEREIENLPTPDLGLWKTAHIHISDMYGLTARERDIFSLLSRGRSINYMSEFFTISEHTVKTHVYHVYAKLGVSSQQELITVVENCVTEIKGLSKLPLS